MKRRKSGRSRSKRQGPQAGFDQSKEVRAIARERIGTVKSSHPIESKDQRKKPKHKKLLVEED